MISIKYVLINIKNFVKNEFFIFFLIILCILSSSIIIHFSFGFYHHLKQKKLDAENNTKELSILFNDTSRTIVTKGSIMDMLLQLSDTTLDDCIITIEGRLAEDQTKDPVIDNTTLALVMDFSIQNGKVTAAPIEKTLKENAILKDGSYFTAEQVENGELVCLALPEDREYEGEAAKWRKKYSADADGKYTIDGKKYTCIGHIDSGFLIPNVPVTTVSDDCYIKLIFFEFETPLTRNAYTEITKSIRETYGNLAEIPIMDILEVDSLRFYNTLVLLCILLISMSGVVLSVLYEYILLQQRRQLTIYRLCGMTIRKAKTLYFTECLLLSTLLYLLAILFFHFILLPYLSNSFEYIAASYSLYSYTVLGVMYIGITSCILYAMICRQMRYNVASALREV